MVLRTMKQQTIMERQVTVAQRLEIQAADWHSINKCSPPGDQEEAALGATIAEMVAARTRPKLICGGDFHQDVKEKPLLGWLQQKDIILMAKARR